MVITKRRSAQVILSILLLGSASGAMCGVQDGAEKILAVTQGTYSCLFLANIPGNVINWASGRKIIPCIGGRTIYSGLGSICSLFGAPDNPADFTGYEIQAQKEIVKQNEEFAKALKEAKSAEEKKVVEEQKNQFIEDKEFNEKCRKYFLHPVRFGLSWLPYWSNPWLGVGKVGWKYSWNMLKKKNKSLKESLLGYTCLAGSTALVLARLYAQWDAPSSVSTTSGNVSVPVVQPSNSTFSSAADNFHFAH